MKKPKILFISYAFYPQMGGIEVNAQVLAGNFHQMGYEIQLLTMIEEKGDRSFPFPVIRNPNITELLKLHKWADVVFENNPSLRLAWPKFFSSAKSVIAIRTQVERNDGSVAIQDRFKQFALNRADGVIAVSKAIRDNYFPKATVIGNPYRHKLFRNTNSHRAELSFVFLGRLVSEKGIYIAIEAFKILCEKYQSGEKKPTLKIIGEGSDLELLQKTVQKYDLENNISFYGRKEGEELVALLNTAKYILIPSKWEPFGNVALEGIACGCLPFVSNTGGLIDAAGEAGVKFKAGSSDSLAKAIFEILNNPDLETAYRSKMKPHLKEHFEERVAQKYLNVIENAILKDKK